MRKLSLIASMILLCMGNYAFADNNTRDTTNSYSPANQENEKMHQKPDAQDEHNSSANTTSHSQDRSGKKHLWSRKKDETSTTSGSSSTDTNR